MAQIVSREEAGLAPPAGRLQPIRWPSGVDLWVHHSDGVESRQRATTFGLLGGIQAFHTGRKRGWSDIGYAFAIDSIGTIVECRGAHLGAHSPGRNHEPSVVLLGSFHLTDPPTPMRRAVFDLLDHLGAGDLRGHRENTRTTCPGDRAMALIVNTPELESGDGRSLRQRIIDSGYGPKSADVLVWRIRHKQFGTVPRRTDSRMIRQLRDRGGLGIASARLVIRAGRFRP